MIIVGNNNCRRFHPIGAFSSFPNGTKGNLHHDILTGIDRTMHFPRRKTSDYSESHVHTTRVVYACSLVQVVCKAAMLFMGIRSCCVAGFVGLASPRSLASVVEMTPVE